MQNKRDKEAKQNKKETDAQKPKDKDEITRQDETRQVETEVALVSLGNGDCWADA